MGTIHTAGHALNVDDGIALKVLDFASALARGKSADTVILSKGEDAVAAFVVGHGIPLMVTLDGAPLPEGLQGAGMQLRVRSTAILE